MNYIIEITTTFSVGAVAGYFFRIFFEDKVIRKRDRDNRYAEAYHAFAKAFSRALHMLDDPKEIACYIISDEFPMHEKAMLDFMPIIRGTKREDTFRKKWADYKYKYERIKKYSMSKSINDDFPDLFELDKKTVKNFHKDLKRVINDLLKAAKKG